LPKRRKWRTGARQVSTGKYDIIIVDYEMPKMKGDQLAVAIRGLSPHQPILMLTAHGEKVRAMGPELRG